MMMFDLMLSLREETGEELIFQFILLGYNLVPRVFHLTAVR